MLINDPINTLRVRMYISMEITFSSSSARFCAASFFALF